MGNTKIDRQRIETAVARGAMKLPAGALAKLAGEPVVIDGRTLDVRLALAAKNSADAPPMHTLSPVEARAASAAAFAMTNAKRPATVSTNDRTIPGGHGASVGIRIYRADGAEGLRPGMLFMHQGGYVVGDLDTCDSFCAQVANTLGAVVISLDYRMGPEHRYPAAANDADAAWAWINDNAEGLGINANRLVIAGDSAGGHMTATLCQRLLASGRPLPAVQVMVYPLTDGTAEGGSLESCANAFPLTNEIMEYFMEHAMGNDVDPAKPEFSPALSPNLAGLPPTVLVTAGFDPLRDQGMAYADKLRDAGVTVISRCEDSLSHSFLSFDGIVPAAKAASAQIIADIDSLLP